jgi:Flp pilus assembly protein TadG
MARKGLGQRLTGGARAVWRGFMGGNRGGVAIWAGFLIVPLLGFMGLGVDTARGYMVRTRLSQALDAAGLAAGKWSANTAKAEEEAAMTFNLNFPPGYMDAAVSGPTITFNSLNDLVTVAASATLPTYFVHLLGVDNFVVSASTEVARKTVYMDIVMSLDVSGSMDSYISGVKKIDAARQAAHTLTDSLFGASETKEFLKMGLVTWNSNARILPIGVPYSAASVTQKTVTTYNNPYRKIDGTYWGAPFPTVATFNKVYFANGVPVPLMTQPPSSWKGCVMARYTPDASTDNKGDVHVGVGLIGTVQPKQWMAWQPAPNTYQCPTQGTRRLTNVKAQVHSAIDLVINPGNNTNLAVGLVWGWRLLGTPGSPFAGDGTPPPASPEIELVRAIILMTDGANTQASTDAYKGWLNASALNSRTQAVATKIKETGVIIYAIQFGYNDGPQETLMKSIASGPTSPYYQYAPDAPALQMVFKEIGNHLSKLRLAK